MFNFEKSESRLALFLLIPSLTIIGVIVLYPMLNAIYMSFTDYNLAFGVGKYVGLENYRQLFGERVFPKALSNSLIYTVAAVVGQFVIGLLIAFLLNASFPGRAIFRGALLIPWLVPSVITAMTWRWMYGYQFGVLNDILLKLGLISQRIDWLGNPKTALWAVIAVDIWKAIPFMAVMLLAGLQSVPSELKEAVQIDGGNLYHTFRYVIMPHLKAVASIALVLRTIWTLNRFELVYLLTQGGPGYASQILPTYSYIIAFNSFDLGKAAAVSGVLLVILSVLAIVYVRMQERESSLV